MDSGRAAMNEHIPPTQGRPLILKLSEPEFLTSPSPFFG